MTTSMTSRVVARLIATLAAAAFVLFGAVSPASAHTEQGNAVPGNDSAHPWPDNGCGGGGALTLNSVAGVFDFKHACTHHDGCYGGFQREGSPTYWVSRSQCDTWFLFDMQASCRWQHGDQPEATENGRTCLRSATTYHQIARIFGRPNYAGPVND